MSQSLYAHHALLPDGWAKEVRLHWNAGGDITAIERDAHCQPGEAEAVWVLPGMTNLHSHAFQRAMAGMTEIAGDTQDSFWTWRDLMYRYALHIQPEHLQAIAAQLYAECLKQGYTGVCEFHYLHHAPDGKPYTNPAEMSECLISAARESGIGLTMLPVLYSYADFGERALREDQRRFATGVDDILALVQLLDAHRDAQTEVGVAPHSLRAASIAQIRAIAAALPAARPLHIHIAEQQREVDACLAFSGQRPVELLLSSGVVDQRWCLVHATHLTTEEVKGIATSKAVAGICTTTEGNLGDGFFPLPDFIAAGGRFGIGSDSHVSQSPVEELRWLEYGQRLRLQGRNIATGGGVKHVGDFLWQAAIQGGAQASGRRVGQLASGYRADMVVLDERHPNLHGLASQNLLNTWIFAGNETLVLDVYAGGRQVVRDGRHCQQEAIANNFLKTMSVLRSL